VWGCAVAIIGLAAVIVGYASISTGYDRLDPPRDHPLSKVVKDDRPPFRLDPVKPWRIEFGRGSGYHGLDTVKLDQGGHLVLHRLGSRGWETAAVDLQADVVAQVLEAVEANRLLELDKAYHADLKDGTQWVLWVRQGEQEKAVYFDNHFPDQIVCIATIVFPHPLTTIFPQ